MKLEFAKHAYQSRSKNLASQRLINGYLEPAPKGSKSQDVIFGTAGLTLFANVGDGPIWGMKGMGDYLYVGSGNNIYRVSSNSSATNLGSIGTTTSSLVMDTNGTDVIVVKAEGAAYLADSSSLTQISDPDFESASSVTVLDGYAIFSRLDTSQYAISAINNAASYDALDFATAEESPDKLVRVFAHQGNLYLFGEETTEVHYNSGAGDFPFIPISQAAMMRGCAAKLSVVEEDNTLFFLGDDKNVYRLDGYTPRRISTFAIEDAINSYTTISDAEAFAFTENGHKFYVLTFPTELVTWVYDISTELWHQRQSFEKGRWRAASFDFFFNKNLVGDFENGNIYEIDTDVYDENGSILQFIATSQVVFNDKSRITHDRLWADFDSGVGLQNGQGSDPQVMLRYSNNGGQTWSKERWRSMGAIGEYTNQVHWTALGQARERIYELSITDPVKRHLTGAYLRARMGSA